MTGAPLALALLHNPHRHAPAGGGFVRLPLRQTPLWSDSSH